MNIVVITDDFYPKIGGISNVLFNLYNNFLKTKHNLFIFNPFFNGENAFKIIKLKKFSSKDLKTFIKNKQFYQFLFISLWNIIQARNIKFSHRIKMIIYLLLRPKEFLKIIENIIILKPILNKLDFQLIVGGHSGWILPLVFILSRIFNRRMISIAYGNDFLISNPLSFKTYYFKTTEKIIVISKEMRRIIKRMHHLDDKQLEIINVGINLEDYEIKETKEELRKEFGIPLDIFVLLSVGRHVPRKKFDLVIRAVHAIKQSGSSLNLKYYLVGEGKQTSDLKKLVKDLSLENEVKFLGTCSIEKRNKFFKLSDLFLMPSVTEKDNIEGFGIVFLEANYFKVPVIGSATGGVVDAIINGKTGFLVIPNNLEDLIEKILLLYNNEPLRIQMGEFGYERVVNHFSWEKIVKDYIKLFHKILNS